MKKNKHIAILTPLLLFFVVASPALAYRYHARAQSWHLVKSTTSVPKPTVPVVVKEPPVSLPASTSEVRLSAYLTGYGWPDNTPAGGAISNGVIHKSAGGSGTYADPITLAVGHSIIGGKDILDYAAGSRVYVPTLRKYFIVEDTCGDGSQPQNGPCHAGFQGHVWLDVWVGGQGQSSSSTMKCEEAITAVHSVIINPASTYTVVSGPVSGPSACAQQFGDTIVGA